MHHLCLILLVLFLFYPIFLYLHNLLVLLKRVLLLGVGSRLVRRLDGALLLLIDKSLELIDISMKLAGMLIALLPEIILHRFEVDGLQDDVEILRYT